LLPRITKKERKRVDSLANECFLPFSFDGGKKIERNSVACYYYVLQHCVLLSMVVQQPGAADRQTKKKEENKSICIYKCAARGAVFLIFLFFLFFIIGLS
jgi:hypothetical protein